MKSYKIFGRIKNRRISWESKFIISYYLACLSIFIILAVGSFYLLLRVVLFSNIVE